MPNFLIPNWLAPDTIRAVTTTRQPGQSHAPFDQNNLGMHVGDNPTDVISNRANLLSSLSLPSEPAWLEQTHSTHCINVDEETSRTADAAITRDKTRVLAIMTADCLPILLTNRQGTEIAAIHAGWRGLVNGVIENTIAQLKTPAQEMIAWIGPSICQNCYEVGDEVRQIVFTQYQFAKTAFKESPQSTHQVKKWLANLPQLAEAVLKTLRVNAVYQSNACTFEQKEYFYSYRRAAQTGRMATLIWFT